MPEPMKSGATLLAEKEYVLAVPILKAEHEKYPNNPRISLQYADALAGSGRLAEAAENYEATARYYDDNGLTVQAIAVRKRAEKARHPIQRDEADAFDPQSLERSKVIATAEELVAQGKVDAAIEEYSKLLDETTFDVNTMNRIGDLWVRINRNDEAVKVFMKIAQHYAEDGFFLKAIATYKKINKLDPSMLEVYARLADLYAKQGLAMEAKSQYQVLADYYLKHGEPENALGIYKKLSELDPNSILVHVKLAELYSSSSQLAEAMKEYDRVGRMLLNRGRLDEAVQVLRKALSLRPSSVDIGLSLATALFEAKDYAGSADLLGRLSAVNPENSDARILLARAHLAQRNVTLAAIVLQALLVRDSGNESARELLADCYVAQKQLDLALTTLRPAVDGARERGDYDAAIGLLQRIVDAGTVHEATQELIVSINGEKNRKEMAGRVWPRVRALIDGLDRDEGGRVPYVSRPLGSLKGVPSDRDAIGQLMASLAGSSMHVVVLGTSGIGKTFLLHELARRLLRVPAGPLPLLVEPRHLSPAANVREAIATYLAANKIDNVTPADCLELLEHGAAVLLLDDVDGLEYVTQRDLEAFAKVVVTAHPSPPLVVKLGLPTWRLLPFTLSQVRNVLGNRWRNERRVRQWMEVLQRDEGLRSLCQSPATLNLIAELDVETLFQSGNVESDSVTIAAVYGLLFGANRQYEAAAVRMWETGKRRLTAEEAGTVRVGTDLMPANAAGEVSFAHEALLEWLVASNAVEVLGAGREPSAIGFAPMPQQMVEFFCDLAGYVAAREWAAATLSRSEIAGHARDNAEAILRHIGGNVSTQSAVATSVPPMSTGAADKAEMDGRLLLARISHRANEKAAAPCY